MSKLTPGIFPVGTIALGMLVWAAGCRTEHAPTKPAPTELSASLPAPAPKLSRSLRFDKEVGQMDEDNGFVEFIRANSGNTVDLDITLPENRFQGGDNSTGAFFVVFDECEGLQEGEKPSAPRCTGTEFHLPHPAGAPDPLVKEGDARRLRGKFKVTDRGGPLQGLMAYVLETAE